VIRVLPHLLHQPLDVAQLAAIRGNTDRLRSGRFVGQRVERGDCFFARSCFARRDEDLGAPGLEEAGGGVET
jgi:hypothetical protein